MEILDPNRPNPESGEPLTIQSYLQKRRHISLEQDYLHMTDGTSADDSVSQMNRSKNLKKNVSQPPSVPTITDYRADSADHNARDRMRNNKQYCERRQLKENYKSNISAKEKTGVDPLSQVNIPLDVGKGHSLKGVFGPQSDTTSSISTSSRRGDWTQHRDAPRTSKLHPTCFFFCTIDLKI